MTDQPRPEEADLRTQKQRDAALCRGLRNTGLNVCKDAAERIDRLTFYLAMTEEAVSEKDTMYHQEWGRAYNAETKVRRLNTELAEARLHTESYMTEVDRLRGLLVQAGNWHDELNDRCTLIEIERDEARHQAERLRQRAGINRLLWRFGWEPKRVRKDPLDSPSKGMR